MLTLPKNVQGDLAVHAVSPNATHHDSTMDYDVHNLWGHGILNATYRALLNVFPGKRPFIIGRSTFIGSGMFAGHWQASSILSGNILLTIRVGAETTLANGTICTSQSPKH